MKLMELVCLDLHYKGAIFLLYRNHRESYGREDNYRKLGIISTYFVSIKEKNAIRLGTFESAKEELPLPPLPVSNNMFL